MSYVYVYIWNRVDKNELFHSKKSINIKSTEPKFEFSKKEENQLTYKLLSDNQGYYVRLNKIVFTFFL